MPFNRIGSLRLLPKLVIYFIGLKLCKTPISCVKFRIELFVPVVGNLIEFDV